MASFLTRYARGALVIAAVVSSRSTIARSARANGRFPAAQAIESVPGRPSTLFLRATFGLLVSHDAGRSWRWICERALGYEGQWDPPIAATGDGRLWVGLEDGMTATSDGCGVEAVPELAGETVRDLTVDPGGERVWAITGAPGKRAHVWRRLPGKRFERLAALEDLDPLTIEVAPSRLERIYVSGRPHGAGRGRLLRSDDGGATFTRAAETEGRPFIGAVDRDDADRLVVRHLRAEATDLLLSRDGGRTFTSVLTVASAMLGFARTPDGTSWFAGSGLPEHGLFRSSDRGERFEPIAPVGVLCLHAVPGALLACENALTVGAPAIGISRDDGRTLTHLARFADVEGPVACAAPDAAAALCAPAWSETRATFAAAPAPPPPAAAPPPRRSSCHCEAGASGRAPLGVLGCLIGVALTRRRCSRS